jgi:hypothetical protein
MGIVAINGQSITASGAATASATTVIDTTTGTGPYYLVFVDGTSGARRPFVDSSALTYNATSNTLTALTFAGTASWATAAVTASRAQNVDLITNANNNNTNYLVFTPSFNAGGLAPVALSESANVTFNPSTLEFRAALVNNTQNGSKTSTADANLTIDASLTQSMTWIASLTTTRSLIVNNLVDGREVVVYIRNTNATQRQIIFSGSTTTTGHTPINMAAGAGAASVTTQNIAGTSGTMYVVIRTIGATFAGGIM